LLGNSHAGDFGCHRSACAAKNHDRTHHRRKLAVQCYADASAHQRIRAEHVKGSVELESQNRAQENSRDSDHPK
jgi:hypothetical protein